jgi:D-beta-D-heptose 7-phosphate kinase / D-beta-D-heptose 1-phosphate adenosyltransferase
MRQTVRAGAKVLGLAELLAELAPRRAAGARLVLTNGCFDLLHRGHVRYLADAAELADLLVVGVNSDASVRQLKGADRPLVPAAERAEVLAALAAVDYVTIFDTPTAEPLLAALRPDVYVKGGDYADRPPPEAALAAQLGAEFRALALVPDSSTSGLVERIRAQEPSREG